ncbi:hypothetical protein A2U01_0102088, partial [Trifolium medium]|nr:hypothetical protein [Trifolium medium]
PLKLHCFRTSEDLQRLHCFRTSEA